MNVYLLVVLLVVAVILFLYLMPARMELFSLGSTSSQNRDDSLSNKVGKNNILRVVTSPMVKHDRMGRSVYHINLSKVSNYHNISDMQVTTPVQSVILKWNGYPLYRSNSDLPADFLPVEYMSPYPVTLEVTALEEPRLTFTLYQKEIPASSKHKLVSANFTFANSNYKITDGMVTRLT